MTTLKSSKKAYKLLALLLVFFATSLNSSMLAQGFEGYYRYPNIHGNTIIFTAEGDLWKVSQNGGIAQRITSHLEEEIAPAFSPDGTLIAYSANYEGPTEVYTIPINGGIPTRWTYESDFSLVNGWTPDGKIVYDTRAFSTLPNRQLVTIDINSKQKEIVPLSQASEASFSNDGKTVFFVRPADHGNVTKRYKGGTARQVWKFQKGSTEAIKLTNDYAGESHHPMYFNERVYHITDRDGTMNIWSVNLNGSDLQQHTFHKDFDIRYAQQNQGKIVYQLGADIWLYDISKNTNNKVDIKIASDLSQLQEKWEENPKKYITSVKPNFKGDKIAITSRGRVFVFPTKEGRIVNFTQKSNVRYRDAIFSHDDENIYALSDESSEFEFVSLPANGIGKEKQISTNGSVLRYEGEVSPDGKHIAYSDLENKLFILTIDTGNSVEVPTKNEGIGSISWSPDSKYIAYVQTAYNTMDQIYVYNIASKENFPITTDRANNKSPQWSLDGKYIYFLSDRSFTSLVGSPWGTRQPEPYFDASEKLYCIPLTEGTTTPFTEENELTKLPKCKEEDKENTVTVKIDANNIISRLYEIPIKAGNYSNLQVSKDNIFLLKRETGIGAKTHLATIEITNKSPKIEEIVNDVQSFDLSGDKSNILLKKSNNYYMFKTTSKKVSDLDESKISLENWKFPITPKEDWEQIFVDAWRMERDYFYDQNMHGVNWDAMLNKYKPLLNRVTTREELSDLIGRYVGELSALHTSVRGGDTREDKNDINVASLGAKFSRDTKNNGYKIEHIYKADPDYPDEKSPLDNPALDINVGDIITAIDGQDVINTTDIGALIRNKENKQVRLTIKGKAEDVIVKPIKNEYSLRYRDWEYSRRKEVENKTDNKVGYVHLQAMTAPDLNQWYREFYPVFDRQGLIIDVRNNRGGNIESFILEKLLRKAWMYWKQRSGKPYWNMQYAFRGHIVILVNGNTASDGEAFAEGFRELNLGKAIGTRTWGGEIWLSGVNQLSDKGIARAPMMGVYNDKGEWVIEGHGFEPDIEVDNLPHETFNGKDAQLETAINHLLELIKKDPRLVPEPPAFPNKSFNNN
ncbi:S41 family peptidase [Joostella sp. CR20]|uniref:S41 family peptidase n=1 Tax=Joostella sp. CR20 TaxID=2804312 RepID=UPI00313D58F6